MNQKQLFYITGKCLALDDHPENSEIVRTGFENREITPENLVRISDSHYVLPVTYQKLKNHNLLDYFPTELKTRLAGLYLRNKQRNLEILRQAEEINRVLDKENIQPIYLKGVAHIMDNLYSDLGERLIGDIDLLVQEQDYLKAVELLNQTGYFTRGEVFSDVRQSTHYPPLYKDGTPVHIEIHRLPVHPPHSKWFSTSACFQHKKKIPGKVNCFVQSIDHQIIHNFIHSRLNNLGHNFYVVTLRDLYDFCLLSKKAHPDVVLQSTPHRNKLSAYYALVDRVFSSGLAPENAKTERTQQYIRKFDWYLEHPRLHHWHIFTVKFHELVFLRFIPSLGALFTAKFWSRTFRNLTKAGFYNMLAYRVRHFYEFYIRRR